MLIELIYVICARNSAKIIAQLRNQKPQSISRSIGGPSVDQLIDWGVFLANNKLLDRSADRSGRVLSRTESLGIDHWIDQQTSVANRELWNRSLDRLIILDRSADRSRIYPVYSSKLNRSVDRSDHSNRSNDRLGGLITDGDPLFQSLIRCEA